MLTGGEFVFVGNFCEPSVSIVYNIVNFVFFVKKKNSIAPHN